MFLDEFKKLDLRKRDAMTSTKFLQKVFGDAYADFQSECVLRIQLLGHDDLVEIFSTAMHQLFEAITLLAEPVCDNGFLTKGQVLVIDHFAERVCPLLKNGQIDPSQEDADHRSPKRMTEKVSLPSIARNDALTNHQNRGLDVVKNDPRPCRVTNSLIDELVGRIVLIDLVDRSTVL